MNQRYHRHVSRLARAALFVAAVAVLWAPSAFGQQPTQEELDQRFSAMMDGVRLKGQFNVVGAQGQSPAQVDLYMVSELSRGEGNTWIFNYSMSFNQDQKMTPIPVEVLWAGDTPVLTMTDQEIEGLQGLFSARLLIHEGKYGGTWKHGAIGGLMWGVLEKITDAE